MIYLFFISFYCAQPFNCPHALPRPWFHIFEHWAAGVKKKIPILLVQIIKNVTLFKKSRGRRDKTLNSQEIPANSSSSLHEKVIFQFIVYYYKPSPNKLKGTPNTVDQGMDLLLSRP